MKNYTVIEVTSNWMGTAKSLAEGLELVLNEKTAGGYELVSIGFSETQVTRPIAIVVFSK